MQYTAVSPDDPSLGKLDRTRVREFDLGVLANYGYNSLLRRATLFFPASMTSQIAAQFSKLKLGRCQLPSQLTVTVTLCGSIAEIFPAIKLVPNPSRKAMKWSEIVENKQELCRFSI